jgi:hypothetical protein
MFDLGYRPGDADLGSMNQESWQKVIDFSIGAGIIKEAQAPSNKEGVLWTNQYVGKP